MTGVPLTTHPPTTAPLATVLDQAIQSLWPHRASRELLLDLGERKRWSQAEHQDAIEHLAAWLGKALLLPVQVEVPVVVPADLVRARRWGEALAPGGEAGVARWAVGLAPALGTTGKTLANSVSRGLRADRADHRWLQVLARPGDAESAWLFHQRSPLSVGVELGRIAAHMPHLDAGDATLVLSLIALWQRRRPVAGARGNRGRVRPRRLTPKPVAGLSGTLLSPGQLKPLGTLAAQMGAVAGRALLLLGVEAALSEAHLAPHPSRHSSANTTGTGEVWLRAAERALRDHAELLQDDEPAVFLFRIARMRAWRDGTPLQDFSDLAVRHPYVRASLVLNGSIESPSEPFDAHTPGLLMLLPQLRSRDLLARP